MKIHEFVEKASQEEIFGLFIKISRALIKQEKIKRKSSEKELRTKCSNKKQYDSLYAKSFNDHRIYNSLLDDLKILIKYI